MRSPSSGGRDDPSGRLQAAENAPHAAVGHAGLRGDARHRRPALAIVASVFRQDDKHGKFALVAGAGGHDALHVADAHAARPL
jgi:hypothetical protein